MAVARELLQIKGYHFFLSEKLTQDPLEEHFAKQRLRGGCNENPALVQLGSQELVLNVISSGLIKEIRGNTRGRNRDGDSLDINDRCQLPKKKKELQIMSRLCCIFIFITKIILLIYELRIFYFFIF